MATRSRTLRVAGPGGVPRAVYLTCTAPGTWRTREGALFMHYGHAWLGPEGRRYRVEKWGGPHTDRTFQTLQAAVKDWLRAKEAKMDAEIDESLAKESR